MSVSWLARLNLVAAVLLLAVSALLYLPAPLYPLWVVAAVVNELPLALAFLGMILLAVSQILFCFSRYYLLAMSSTAIAAIALSLALTQVQTICTWADTKDVKLNWMATLNVLGRFLGQPPKFSADVLCERGLQYAKPDGKPLLLDVYHPPKGREGKLFGMGPVAYPAIVIVHGGSWRGGKRSDFAPL